MTKQATAQKSNVAEISAGKPKRIEEHIIEVVSDSGEGAQKCGQTFGTVSGKMGNGVWTVEIIPAEIQPPARSKEGASGVRIRLGSKYVTNMGDQADLVIAFNEQVLYNRIVNGAFRKGTVVLLESKWAEDPQPAIREQYAAALADFNERGLIIHELPLEKECLKIVKNARQGKNMFVLGMLCRIYSRDTQRALDEIAKVFARKGEKVIKPNHELFKAGYQYAAENLDYHYEVIPEREGLQKPTVVTNGNTAVGLGILASGMDMLAMYPITPATSVSHYVSEVFHHTGGFMHQAEDEIAAVAYAVGSSFAGRTAVTVTSGPGMALKTEILGLAVMCEVPLVVVNVQRGGPATGQPTKIEQGDLLSAIYSMPGDAPKIVMAPATISECFHFVITARKLAEAFRTPVIILTDANLATAVQPYDRPEPQAEWLSAPIDQSEWDKNIPPYDWDDETGLSPRPIPGQPGGEYVLTGLAHTKRSKVAYDSMSNQIGCNMRSRKMSAFAATLQRPEIYGDKEGDILVLSWGSTMGAVREAVDRMRADGHKISNVHLRFLHPFEKDLKEIFSKFKKVMTVELNYSDDPDMPLITDATRRYAQLANILRHHTLLDIDCWSIVQAAPLQPGVICEAVLGRLKKLN